MPESTTAPTKDKLREACHEPWYSPRDRLRFIDLAPHDRFCDLILTGGVTSAVAYPGLVAVLASAYRFHAVGGSSSGAGIAAMAAAAEFRRRQGSAEGFRTMLERVGRLAEETPGHARLSRAFERMRATGLLRLFQPMRSTRLSRLFQPMPKHRLLFDLLVFALGNPGHEAIAAARFVLGRCALAWLLLVLAALLSPHWLDGRMSSAAIAACVGWTLLFSLAAGLFDVWWALRRALSTDYGVCSGIAEDGRADPDAPPLTDWLHGVIQEVAGRTPNDAPLTFDDLARAPGSPRAALGADGSAAQQGISLQVYSANVTHGRPYRFPLADDERLYFCPCELRRVVPDQVVEFILRTCVPEKDRWPQDKDKRDEQARWLLPRKKLPIIVAARMSVSFPLLFTAVRLWAPHGPADNELHPCWFMDGGLCSNFPIHLFDSALPAWPTFGVSLHDRRDATAKTAKVFLPQRDHDGKADDWVDLDRATGSFAQLSGIVGAMLRTAKDWNDATSARLPGVWDRVVRVELEKTEGGLNIAMPSRTIETIARYGTEAGRELIDRFSRADAANGLASGWNEHRWMRLTRLRAALARHLEGVGWSIAPGQHAEPMSAQIQRAIDAPPRLDDPALSAAQAAALQQLLGAVMQAERALNASGPPLPQPPDPQPELRLRAPL